MNQTWCRQKCSHGRSESKDRFEFLAEPASRFMMIDTEWTSVAPRLFSLSRLLFVNRSWVLAVYADLLLSGCFIQTPS